MIDGSLIGCQFCGDDDLLPIYEDGKHVWAINSNRRKP